MGGESGKRSEGRRRHSWRAMSRRRERAPRSQPPDGAKADGRGFGIGSKGEPRNDGRSLTGRMDHAHRMGVSDEGGHRRNRRVEGNPGRGNGT